MFSFGETKLKSNGRAKSKHILRYYGNEAPIII